MSDTTSQQIVDQLKDSSTAGLSFAAAKEKLLAQGFTDEQIRIVTDDYTYGSKPVPDIPTKVEQYFEKHPDQALADGTKLVKAQRDDDVKDEKMQASLDIAAAMGAPRIDQYDIQSRVEYEHRFANDVGISFWTFIALGIFVNMVAYVVVLWLKIPHWAYAVNALLSLVLIVILIKRIK